MKLKHPLAKVAALSGLAALGMILALGAADAKPDNGKHRGKRFLKLDADGDGKLSAAEVADTPLADRFATLDTDGDGYLVKAEMKKGKGKGKGKWHEGRKHRGFGFSKLDANGDGLLSPAEVANTRMARRFATMDADGDGFLTKDEMKKSRRGRKAKRGKGGKAPQSGGDSL